MYVLRMRLLEWVGQLLLNKYKRSLFFAAILFLLPFHTQAGFPREDIRKKHRSFHLSRICSIVRDGHYLGAYLELHVKINAGGDRVHLMQ